MKRYENRQALCIDVTPNGGNWRMSVQNANQSPQRNVSKLTKWLSGEEAKQSGSLPASLLKKSENWLRVSRKTTLSHPVQITDVVRIVRKYEARPEVKTQRKLLNREAK